MSEAKSPVPETGRWPRRVVVLGSTGFIGQAACDVISRLPDRLELFGLSARSQVERLSEQIRAFQPQVVALAQADRADELRARVGSCWSGTLLLGPDAPRALAVISEVDVVLNGLVGAIGLRPTWDALEAGKTVALANKESVVMAGELLMRAAGHFQGRLLPVDSEHSALFQCLEGHPKDSISRLILTASGGPFRERALDTFDAITPEEALHHPTWVMGARITVDSATLINKGFEVLEARWLFGVQPEQIEVWIHPQSIVHGLVEWVDGSTTAQLSLPDMRIPISYALCYPERRASGLSACALPHLAPLEFSLPDLRRFPCLEIAREALRQGGTAPAVLNAADEVLVSAFLERRIRFSEIASILRRVVEEGPQLFSPDLDQILEADRWARRKAAQLAVAGA